MLSSWAYADSERLVYYLETWAWATIQPMKMHFSFRKVLPTPQYSIQGMMAFSSYTSWEHPSHKTVAEQTEFEERRCPSERNRCHPLPLSGRCSWVDKNTRKLGVGGVNFILLRFNFNSWLLNNNEKHSFLWALLKGVLTPAGIQHRYCSWACSR